MKNIIIDTDSGIDDAQAILMALSAPDVNVVAITVVAGNTSLDNATTNVLRVLNVAERNNIPVYRGCAFNILNAVDPHVSEDYHGVDGLGDFQNHIPVDFSLVKQEHASLALLKLVEEYADIELVCLAPLTNVALALRLDPSFSNKLKSCYIMGGNYRGKGNITMTAEFNFFSDPESAHIVLQDLNTKITLVGWEVCEEGGTPLDKLSYIYNPENPSRKQQFMLNIQTNIHKDEIAKPGSTRLYCDEIAMAVCLQPSLVTSHQSARFRVELSGRYSRGLAIPDWTNCGTKSSQPLVTIVTGFNAEQFRTFLRDLLTN